MSGPQAPEKGAATNNKAVLNQLQHVQAQLKNLQSGTRLVHRAMGVPPPILLHPTLCSLRQVARDRVRTRVVRALAARVMASAAMTDTITPKRSRNGELVLQR